MSDFTTVAVEFTGKDQNWQDGETIYWFELDGQDVHNGAIFEGDKYGVVEGAIDGEYPKIVDYDGCPIEGGGDEAAARRALESAVTDELRAE